MKLSDLPQRTLTLHLHGDFEGVEVKVNQEAKIGDLDLILSAASGDVPNINKLAQAVCGIMVSWNMETEEGGRMPIMMDTLKEMPAGFLMAILQAWGAEFSKNNPLGSPTLSPS